MAYPQLPDPGDLELEVWLEELGRHLRGLDVVARGMPGPAAVDRVLFVAPPSGAGLAR